MAQHRAPYSGETPQTPNPAEGARKVPRWCLGALGGGGLALLVLVLGGTVPVGALAVLALSALIGAGALLVFMPPRRSATATIRPVAGATVPPEPQDLVDVLAASRAKVISDELPDPFLLLDARGRILMANPACREIFRSAVPRKHISAVIRTPSVLEALSHVSAGGEPQTVEYSMMVPMDRHMRAHISPIRLPAVGGTREETAILLILYDLTSVKRLEQMRADFVANASHELRTPLASLTGFIETLRGHAKEDPEAREKFLRIMEEQCGRMRRLINDLLSLSRIELNEHVPPSGRVDLHAALSDVIDAVGPIAREQGVALNLSGEAPDTVVGDRDELVQVFQNLIDNAIKYGGDGKRVDISLGIGRPEGVGAPDGEAIYAEIRDYGVGIPREHIPRLTERFYRVDIQRSRERGGTGLGLAIVKHILNRHRGWLEIDSRLGEGSVFRVYLRPSAEQLQRRRAIEPIEVPAASERAEGTPQSEPEAAFDAVSPEPDRAVQG